MGVWPRVFPFVSCTLVLFFGFFTIGGHVRTLRKRFFLFATRRASPRHPTLGSIVKFPRQAFLARQPVGGIFVTSSVQSVREGVNWSTQRISKTGHCQQRCSQCFGDLGHSFCKYLRLYTVVSMHPGSVIFPPGFLRRDNSMGVSPRHKLKKCALRVIPVAHKATRTHFLKVNRRVGGKKYNIMHIS